MSEAVEERVAAEWGAGRLRLPRWAGRQWRGEVEPPPVGTTVGGYRLEARLGEGGQGTVYRARRGGRLYALKFLSLGVEQWAWRELEVRLRLRRVGAVRLEGCGHWPDQAPRFFYLVMPYVRGCRLDAWVAHKNPTAREVALLVRELARQLVAMHRAGVVHRDVKSANVLVRHGDGRPVLVDFGVSTYVGAPEITHPLMLPGTRYYRSPEALRFRREHAGEHSPARASDDLWALGVVLYWLLTGAYPFDTDKADEGALADVILRGEPVPPHERNPRVPPALSELCLRMLEKSPEARYPDAVALGAALEAVLTRADASWDVALCEAWSPDAATTLQQEELSLDEWRERLLRLAAYARQHPRRGRPMAPEEASTLTPTSEAEQPGVRRDEVAAPTRRRTRSSRGRTGAWGGAVLVLGLLGGLITFLLHSPPPPEVAPTPAVTSRSTTSRVMTYGQEVALPWCPLDGGAGAAPVWAPPPAPVASAASPKDSTRGQTGARGAPQHRPPHPPAVQRAAAARRSGGGG